MDLTEPITADTYRETITLAKAELDMLRRNGTPAEVAHAERYLDDCLDTYTRLSGART